MGKKRILLEMAKEIASLRRECDLEWGEWNEENYKIKNIVREYEKNVQNKTLK